MPDPAKKEEKAIALQVPGKDPPKLPVSASKVIDHVSSSNILIDSNNGDPVLQEEEEGPIGVPEKRKLSLR
jgi:hypothetical protein